MLLRPTAVTILAMFLAQQAPAQTAPQTTPTTLAKPEEKLKSLEQDISLSTERQAELATEISALVAADEKLSTDLIAVARQISSQQNAIAAAQLKLEDLKKEDIILRSNLADKREVLSELLAGLQLLERNPPPALIVNPDDILGALRSAMVFGAVVPELKDEAIKLTSKLQRLKDLKSELNIAQETANNQIRLLKISDDEFKTLALEKQALLAKSQQAFAQEEQTIASLSDKAQTLRELLAVLETAQVMEQNRRTLEAEEAQRLVALKTKPLTRLSDAKGRLNYPVSGEIIRTFGEDNGLGSKMSGLALSSLAESIVVSPIDGIVKFAGPFRSLHELVILDTSDNMQVLLAGFDHIDVKIGQTIRAGEPLGALGRKSNVTAFMDTGLGGNKPLLYVEFIKNGAPIDSTPWWVGAQKEAKSK